MARKTFLKNVKAVVALATMATLVMSSALPVYAVGTTNTKADRVAEQKAASSKQMRNVMYYGDWSIWGGEENFYPKDIPAESLTHLNLAFIDLDANGKLVFCDKDANIGHPLGNAGITYGAINGGIVNEMQVLRQRNPNLKIGLSIGGWSKSANFSAVARDASKTDTMVKEICKFLEYGNFDFVDFDWEYPASIREKDTVDNKNDTGTPNSIKEDKANYVTLLKKVRAGVDQLGAKTGKYYEMSAALPMAHSKVDEGIDVKGMFDILDFGNIMTYDAAGAWEGTSGHQAALYDNPNSPYAGKGFSADSSIKYYKEKGAPSEKIVLGAAYYTRGWEKVDNNVPDSKLPGLYGTATKVNKDADFALSYGAKNDKPLAIGDGGRNAGNWAWRNQDKLKAAYPGLKEYWDDTAKAPYLYSESTGAFFTYDNPRSIQEKAKYVKENNLGGMIAWMASNDKPTTSTKRDELTNITKNALFGPGELPTYEVKAPKTYAKADVSVSKPAWGTGSSIKLNIKNDTTLEKNSSECVNLVEEASKTLKYPTVYIKTNGVQLTGGESPTPKPVLTNGEYVLAFNGYDQKLVKPGQTLNLSISTDIEITDLSSIEYIEISQKMYPDAPEFERVRIYTGKPGQYEDEDVNRDKKVDVLDLSAVAAKYNKAKGQTGYDEIHDITKDSIIDLFDLVRVAKKLDTTSGGGGGTTDPEKPDPSIPAWDSTKAYNAGAKVMYNGVVYTAKWWVQGELPDKSNAWEKAK